METGMAQVTFDVLIDSPIKDDEELLALDEALEDLARLWLHQQIRRFIPP
jgi:hypothetical protein